MGLKDIFRRRKDREAAIPKPGTREYEEMISGSTTAPDSEGVESGDTRWTSVGDARSKEEAAGLGTEPQPPEVEPTAGEQGDGRTEKTRAEEQSTILAEVDRILRDAEKKPPDGQA